MVHSLTPITLVRVRFSLYSAISWVTFLRTLVVPSMPCFPLTNFFYLLTAAWSSTYPTPPTACGVSRSVYKCLTLSHWIRHHRYSTHCFFLLLVHFYLVAREALWVIIYIHIHIIVLYVVTLPRCALSGRIVYTYNTTSQYMYWY